MPSRVPKVRTNLGFIHWSSGPAIVRDWDTEALLVSQPHWKIHDGTWSGGGPFYVWKRKVNHTSKPMTFVRLDNVWSGRSAGCAGSGIYPDISSKPPAFISSMPSFAVASSGLSGKYATGYKRARPGNPVAGVGQFIAELRDLPKIPLKGIWTVPITQLPRVLLSKLQDFRNLGSEYLNVAFGWKPFVKDLQDMYNLWKSIDKRMAEIIRNNGRYIRRRAEVENDESSTSNVWEYNVPYAGCFNPPPGWPVGKSIVTRRAVTKTHIWFVGAFRYYIPDVGSSLWDARARAALFGALPTPELLWNVLPWSWLVDWFANIGDIVSNASSNAVDNLTTRYSFIMKHVTETLEYTCQCIHSGEHVEGPGPPYWNVSKDWDSNEFTYTSRQVTETKVRLGGGNPFGLDVQLGSLSAYQLSILTALGLSRGLVR